MQANVLQNPFGAPSPLNLSEREREQLLAALQAKDRLGAGACAPAVSSSAATAAPAAAPNPGAQKLGASQQSEDDVQKLKSDVADLQRDLQGFQKDVRALRVLLESQAKASKP
jgi:hypothetical protein